MRRRWRYRWGWNWEVFFCFQMLWLVTTWIPGVVVQQHGHDSPLWAIALWAGPAVFTAACVIVYGLISAVCWVIANPPFERVTEPVLEDLRAYEKQLKVYTACGEADYCYQCWLEHPTRVKYGGIDEVDARCAHCGGRASVHAERITWPHHTRCEESEIPF